MVKRSTRRMKRSRKAGAQAPRKVGITRPGSALQVEGATNITGLTSADTARVPSELEQRDASYVYEEENKKRQQERRLAAPEMMMANPMYKGSSKPRRTTRKSKKVMRKRK